VNPLALVSPDASQAAMPAQFLVDTVDPARAAAVVGSMLSPHTVRVVRNVDSFRAQVRHRQLGDIHIAHFHYGAEVDILSEPLGCYAINFVLTGAMSARVGRESVQSFPGQAVAFSPFEPSRLAWTQDLELLCLAVPRVALERRARKLTGHDVRRLDFSPTVGLEEARLLRSTLAAALRMTSGRDEPVPGALAWELRDAVLTAMLLDLRHSELDRILCPPKASSQVITDEVLAVMRSNLAWPISIPEIACRVGVSARTIQEGFRVHLGTTPLACFKRLRLEAVREELERRSADETTVTNVAVTTGGFFHLGRFSAEYFEEFGEHPSETLRRPAPDAGPIALAARPEVANPRSS
jgi:AraC-like DNA-binding protein